MTDKKTSPWIMETEGGGVFIIWSEPYNSCAKKAISKLRRIAKDRVGKRAVVVSHVLSCAVPGCFAIADELIADATLEWIPKEWWILKDVELRPGGRLDVATVCPMCEKHAHRFRGSLAERILRIEERLDCLEGSVDGQFDDCSD